MSSSHPLWDNLKDSCFPQLYQAHHREYIEDIPFWLDLARMQGDPILELGCGPGRVLIQLANAGYTCYGIDNDSGMLLQLKNESISGGKGKIYSVLADMTSFQFQKQFPLIILPCNTYSTLELSARSSLLDCIRHHLSDGGVFAVSVPNPETLHNLTTTVEPEFEMFFPHPKTTNPVQVSYQIVRDAEHASFFWYYDQLYPDGNVKRLEIQTSHNLTTRNQYLFEIQSSGLEVHAIYGDFDYTPFDSDSPNLIIITQKSNIIQTIR